MNFCPECGSQLDPDSKFCPNCGHELSEFTSSSVIRNVPPPVEYVPSQSKTQSQYASQTQVQSRVYHQSDSNGTVALIFGILGFFVIPIIGNIIAIIFGAISRSREPNSSTGKAGLVLGIIGILCWIIYFGVILSMIFSFLSMYPIYISD